MGIFKHLTHSSVAGSDYTQCSAAFIYILALFSLKNIIRKTIGIKRPRTREPITISLPGKFFRGEESDNWWESPKWAYFVMVSYYGYTFYRLMRKHQSIKHKVLIYT